MSAPNIDEKIAATYLRLNGFLLLPHFTAFISIENKGKYHRHIDLLGLRAADSEERPFNNLPCLLDENLFKQIEDNFRIANPKSTFLGLMAEVHNPPEFREVEYRDYAANFLGKAKCVSLAFADADNFAFYEGTLVIHLTYALDWIFKRIDQMEKELAVRKTESWALSEEFLSDILILRK